MVTLSITGDPEQIAEVIVAIKNIENPTKSKPADVIPLRSVVAGGRQR